jgi:hypothetical protein
LQKLKTKLVGPDASIKAWQDGSYEKNSITETSQLHRHIFPAVSYNNDLREERVEAVEMLSFTDVKEEVFKYRTTISDQRYAIFRAGDDVQKVTGTELPPQKASQLPELESTKATTVGSEGSLDGPEKWKWYQEVSLFDTNLHALSLVCKAPET